MRPSGSVYRLACTSGCALDKSACFDHPECGDGKKNAAEDCDGSDLGGVTRQAVYLVSAIHSQCRRQLPIATAKVNNHSALNSRGIDDVRSGICR